MDMNFQLVCSGILMHIKKNFLQSLIKTIVLFIGLSLILISLKVAAKTELKGAKEIKDQVFEDLIINGSFRGINIRAHNVVIHGSAQLIGDGKRTEILDDVLVYGSLVLDNVEIQGNVTIYGDLVVKDSYIIGDVFINEKDIRLEGDTTIGGKLVFTENFGMAYLSDITSIIGGIQNGKVYEEIKMTPPIIDGKIVK